jgi:histidinol-phosphate phosphatase family protein
MKQAVILAAGKGKRLLPLTRRVPKPLIKIGGVSVLEHQLALLSRYGVKDVTIVVGYLGETIKTTVGNGKKFNIRINYFEEPKTLGTGWALRNLSNTFTSPVLLLFGDVMMNLDLNKLRNFHNLKKSITTIVVHPTDHAIDSDLVDVNSDFKIKKILTKPHSPGLVFGNLAISGLYILNPKVFDFIPKNKPSNLVRDVFPKLLSRSLPLLAYKTAEYLKDMGTKERLKQVRRDFRSKLIEKRHSNYAKPVVFLDRDGVVIKEVENLTKSDEVKIIQGSARAIKRLNNSEYLSVMVTNQPVIARGWITETELENIHRHMETALSKKSAYLDQIYFCPHHPLSGSVCNCRKPKTGMIAMASKDFNIDKSRSWIIGDRTVEIELGRRAKIKTILVKTGYSGKDGKFAVKPDFVANNLKQAVDIIIKS